MTVTRSRSAHTSRSGLRRFRLRMVRRETEARLVPASVERVDLALFRRAARWHAPVLDTVLPRLTRSGNKSLLWAAIGVLLHLFGGRFGRRASLRGAFSIVLTSFVTNIPAKLLWRRQRPALDEVPQIRRLAKLPTSTSFPSGHSASAFAFATGVALEKPIVGVPLLGLAAVMAYSRVYVGVHYPSDVVGGALIGAGVAVATKRLWPVAPDEPARARPATIDVDERPGPNGSGLTVVVNSEAGNGFTEPPTEELHERLPGAEIIETSEDLTVADAVEKACASGGAIGVAGGDGTVNAAAEAALRAGMPLAVFPGGTLNHFAREVGIDSSDDAIAAVESGPAVGIDVGMIADRPFLNTASFGSYVDLVDARERLEGRIGKWPALVVALARVLRRAEPLNIEIDGKTSRVWMAFVGNCRYSPPGFAPTWRNRLDDEVLDLRLVGADSPFARARLLWAVLTGTLSRTKVYRCDFVRGPVRVRSLDGPMRLARDGETFSGPEEFTIEKAPERLAVFVPPSEEDDASQSGASAPSHRGADRAR
jgi:diacylglycerol kinase family enzyme/membrane-associated phospholipid phosphatase